MIKGKDVENIKRVKVYGETCFKSTAKHPKVFTSNCGCGLLRSKRFTLADAEQTNSIFVADLRFAEQKKYLRFPALLNHLQGQNVIRVALKTPLETRLGICMYNILVSHQVVPPTFYNKIAPMFTYNFFQVYCQILLRSATCLEEFYFCQKMLMIFYFKILNFASSRK